MNQSDEIRQISNTKNVVIICIGIVLIIVAILEVVIRLVFLNVESLTGAIDIIFLVLGIIATLILAFGCINFHNTKVINSSLKNAPYGFDYQKELSTYKVIGMENKKLKNGAKYFSRYSEWKEDLEKRFSKQMNNENFYRFMVRKLRREENYKDLLATVMVPIEIALLTIYCSAFRAMTELEFLFLLFGLSTFLLIFLASSILNTKNKINYIHDFIEIIFPNKKT